MSRDRTEQDGPDDRPLPPRLDPRAGRPPRGPGGSPGSARAGGSTATGRRRTGRFAVVSRSIAAVLSVLLLTAGGWGWHLGRVAEATVNRTDAIPGSGNEGSDGEAEAMNLLLVGNDSRAEMTPEQLRELSAGEDAGINTDTMILVHLPADGSRASFVSFPRDSYVQIPGYGWDKLNAAYSYGYQEVGTEASEAARQAGGAQLLVQTVSRLTGLQVDHYAEVDLLGFFELSSVVGGVEVNLCEPVDDREWSGAVFPAGVQTISGADALKFVRQRHGLPRGDFDRIVRQQVFIAGVLRKMLSDEVLFDLGKQRELVQAAAESLTVDQDLDLFSLAEQMQSVTAGSIEFQTVPFLGDDRDKEGRYILRLAEPEVLREFFADLSTEPEQVEEEEPAEPVELLAASAVPVEVLNGSGTSGLAGKTATELEAAQFPVVGTGNADSQDYERTEIQHAPGDELLAQTLAAQIPGAGIVPSEDAEPGAVRLVLGDDFAGLGRPSTAPAAEGTPEAPRTAEDVTCIY